MKMKLVMESFEQKLEFDVSKYSEKKIKWITIGLMCVSGFLGILAYQIDSWFLVAIGFLGAFFSGQFYYILENYNELKTL